MENLDFRKANSNYFKDIWDIICFAKEVRRKEGSNQWQDGYPNEQTIFNDIKRGNGYILCINKEVVGYIAIIFEIESAYEEIEGRWLTNDVYAVVHRMAVSSKAKNKGIGYILLRNAERIIRNKGINSIRIDTNFDNIPMLKILERENYIYCGEVYFRGSSRKAFEKIL